MTIPNEFVLRGLAEQLPARVNAARHNGLDCVRFTLAEAQALRGPLARELEGIEALAVDARKGGVR